MALGAPAGGVVWMILGRAMILAGIGVGVGVLAALGLGRVLRSQLFGVSVVDPVTLAAVVLVLGASAVLASWLPARRAAGVDPVSVLRAD
jgi:ABC-type antimicrobial peptide transport system permease subunit